MANVRPYKDKDGKIVSYHIEVFRGRDGNGKKLKPYTTTWKVPDTYRSETAIKRALDKFVGEFETSCNRGEVTVYKKTFGEYADYYIDLISKDSKRTTVAFYNSLLPRIMAELGGIKLTDLSAEHLNKFYAKLQDEGIRKDNRAVGKKELARLKKSLKYTNEYIKEQSGLAINTVDKAMQLKTVALTTAEKISKVFDRPMEELFEITSYNGNKLSTHTIIHIHKLIHAVLNLALHEGLVIRNVADSARPPKFIRKEPEFFEIEDIIAIRNALKSEPFGKYHMMIYLLCDTGMRKGELFGLRWSRIDFKNGTILIDNNVQVVHGELYTDTPKTGETRTVAISPEVMKMLRQFKKEQSKFRYYFGHPEYNPEGYLFIQEDTGKPMHPSSLNIFLKRFEKRHNLPHMHPHKFRHSQASILYASGIDVVTISKRLGHQQVSTTQDIYAHMMKESDKKASEAIARALYRNEA